MTKRRSPDKPLPAIARINETERYLRVKAQLEDPTINTMEKNKRSKSRTICLLPDLA